MGWCLLTRVLFVFSFVQLVLRYRNLMEKFWGTIS